MDYDRLFGLVIGTASVILTVTAVICYCSSRPSPRYRRRRGVRNVAAASDDPSCAHMIGICSRILRTTHAHPAIGPKTPQFG